MKTSSRYFIRIWLDLNVNSKGIVFIVTVPGELSSNFVVGLSWPPIVKLGNVNSLSLKRLLLCLIKNVMLRFWGWKWKSGKSLSMILIVAMSHNCCLTSQVSYFLGVSLNLFFSTVFISWLVLIPSCINQHSWNCICDMPQLMIPYLCFWKTVYVLSCAFCARHI